MRRRARALARRFRFAWTGWWGSLVGRTRTALLASGGVFLVIAVIAVAYTIHLHDQVSVVEERSRRAAGVGLLERALLDELEGVRGAAERADLLSVQVAATIPPLSSVREDIVRLRRDVRAEKWCSGIAAAAQRWLSPGPSFRPQCAEGEAARAFFTQLRRIEDDELRALFDSGESSLGLADEAMRNVVTLILLGLLALAFIVVRFPGRLYLPLRRLSAVLHSAEGGRTDIAVPIVGVSELDDIARTLNSMLASFGEFDQRKRARILHDRVKIGILLERLPGPAALVDRRLVIDAANCSMRELLQVGDGCVGRRLTEFLTSGADAFDNAVTSLVKERSAGSEPKVDVELGGVNRTAATATIIPVTGGRGLVEAVLVETTIHRKPML